MLDIILIIFLAIICFSIGLYAGHRISQPPKVFLRSFSPQASPGHPSPPLPEEGQCTHRSSPKMKVTQFGDDEDCYICLHCGEKVKKSELYGGLEGYD